VGNVFADSIRVGLEPSAPAHKGTQSDSAIHPMAEIFGDADALLSMTILRIAAVGGREAIID
jgi:hypothetical protein